MKTTFALSSTMFYKILFGTNLGIFSPILLILLGLWLARGDRSTWYVKAALIGLLLLLFLIMFGII